MDGLVGFGAATAASDITSIGCAFCSATTTATGDVFVLTGGSGATTRTTSRLVGSGVGSVGSDATFTDCASTSGGLVLVGCESVHTGTCTVATIIITVCMAELAGPGEDTDALECTSTDCAPCIEITRAIGDECDRTGICGAETITTSGHDGSGVDTEESDGTCTDYAS